MKNPMARQLEQRLSARAVAIGREGEVGAFNELLSLLRSSSPNVRRLSRKPCASPPLPSSIGASAAVPW